MALRYHSPLAQVLLISAVCFLCPGMFNALNGLGGAGQLDPHTANNANSALYAAFCIFSIAGGGIVNICGVRFTTALACLTYAVYTGSYVHYNNTGDGTPTIIGAREIPYLNQLVGNWALLMFSLPTMVYTVMQIEDRALDDRLLCSFVRDNESMVAGAYGWDLSPTQFTKPRSPKYLARHVDNII
ncbi:hypothetical protein GGF38_002003 [Coemansia sp. RSA 25]|nr:hypothetical protein GGF38_002003 [Coemansia sp. RSA 25]